VHSSSSGAGSGSEESLSVASTGSDNPHAVQMNNHSGNNISNNDNHDYEDIYLVRDESRMANIKHSTASIIGATEKQTRGLSGRSRSRDSGSHSRSASASSAHSNDIIVQYRDHVSIIELINFYNDFI